QPMGVRAGATVFDVNNPGRTGLLTGRIKEHADITRWEVAFAHNEKVFIRAEYLKCFDPDAASIDEKVTHGRYGRADDLRRLLTFEKLKGTLHDFIYSMDAARIDFHEYQFKPVLKFVNSPTA